MRKKIVSLFVAVTMLAFVAGGCGNKEAKAPVENEVTEEAATPADETEDEQAEEAAEDNLATEQSNPDGQEYYKSKMTMTDGEGLSFVEFYTRDSNGVETVTDENGSEIGIREYNEAGDLVKETIDGKVTLEITYDDHGNITLYNQPDITEYTSENTYDDAGNLVRTFSQVNDSYFGSYDREYIYEYDSEGKKIKLNYISVLTIEGEPFDESYVETYEYNAEGLLVKSITGEEGGYQYIETYEYDSNGNMIRKSAEWGEGKHSSTEYTYDANNNLIKEVEDSGFVTEYEYAVVQ